MNNYNFNEQDVFMTIQWHWIDFMRKTNSTKCVIGISGGIDSTCAAALACKIFGKENVIGISLPCDEQKDMNDVDHVFQELGIMRYDFNIGDAFHSVLNGIENNALEVSQWTKTNLPPRLRMASLYAFSQSIPGSIVINTSNLSESCVNWDTLWGDDCGSYAPLKNLTKTEVRKLAAWLNVPAVLVNKTPIDGLQPKSDEESFGFTYELLDSYIRGTNTGDLESLTKIFDRYNSGKFKLDMVNIPGPDFGFPNYLALNCK